MNHRTATVLAIALAALAAPLAGAAAAEPATRVLAPDGDVFAVTQGAYGELFPGGAEALPDDPVLAITIIHPDGAGERLLVPDTAGPAEEELASLVLGPGGETLHVLWQSSAAGSRLWLANLGAEGWGEVVDVSRAVGVVQGSPRAAVTRDRTELPADGGQAPARIERSVLHVVWLEEAGGTVIYAPLVIEDGAYIGEHALYSLDRLVAAGREPAPGGGSSPEGAVALAPGIEAGGDAGATVAAFTDPESGLLVSVELRMVSGELSDLGNRLREGLLELTARLEPGSPDSLRELAAGAGALVIEAGDRLRPALVQLLAGEIERYVLANGSDWAFQPETMADRTRGELLALGAAFDRAPVRRLHGSVRPQLINVGHRSEAAPLPSHDLRLRVTAERPAPVLPEGLAGSIFLSGDGEHALVAWEREGVVFFRESDADAESGWGPVSSLGITAGEDPTPITDLLRDRVRNR